MTKSILLSTIRRGAATLTGVCALLLSPGVSLAASATEYMAMADSAEYYIKKEAWQDASRCLETALKSSPANPLNGMLLSNLGIVRTRLGDTEGALQAFDVALAISPDESRIYDNIALTLISADRLEEAEQALDSSLAIDSVAAWPRKMRGVLRMGRGDIKGAIVDLESSVAANPNDADAHSALARCLSDTGMPDKAAEHYLKAIAIIPEESLYADLALAYLDSGDIDKGSATISEALTRYPGYGNLYLIKAYIDKMTFQNRASDNARATARRLEADPELERRLFGGRK